MKIGILSYPLNNNYGCYLQTFALLKFLKDQGFDVEYIYRRHNKPSVKFYIKYAINTIINNILNYKWQSPFYNYEWEYMVKTGKNLIPFFENYIVPHTELIYTTNKLKIICTKYDVIIVGSDQVWRAELLPNIEDYFLLFMLNKDTKRIAYAASFGKKEPGYTSKQMTRCKKGISRFEKVSVREDLGIDLIRKYGWKCSNPQVVLDPTMLLNKQDYISLIKGFRYDQTVFGYILDQTEEKNSILEMVSNELNIKYFNILAENNTNYFNYPSVERWLGMIVNSAFVVTDSFHGAVFSIIFNKPFIVIVNEERGAARFDTLLGMFNLKCRILDDVKKMSTIVMAKINWEEVNRILIEKRKESISFLKDGLCMR